MSVARGRATARSIYDGSVSVCIAYISRIFARSTLACGSMVLYFYCGSFFALPTKTIHKDARPSPNSELANMHFGQHQCIRPIERRIERCLGAQREPLTVRWII